MNFSKIEPEEMTDSSLKIILNNSGVQINEINYSIENRLIKARGEKPMKQLFGNYLHTGEIMFLAGDTGAGKTLLAFQIADNLTNGKETLNLKNEAEPLKVLYYDFEMSNQALLRRYKEYQFNWEMFNCPDIQEILIQNEGKFDIYQVRNDIKTTGAEVVILDNITAIAIKSTQDQDTALQLMKEFKLLNIEFGTTIIILAHTPKIPSNRPLSINDIAGSKHLTNFADNVSLIGKSSQAIERRYLKQVKSRNSEIADRVLILEIDNNDYLHFDFIGYDQETGHIDINPEKEQSRINDLKETAIEYFSGQGLHYNEFCNKYAEDTGKTIETAKKIHNKLKTYNLIIRLDKKWIVNGNEIQQ